MKGATAKYLLRIRNPGSKRLARLTKFEKDLVVAVDKACENPPERIFEPPCAYCGKKNPEFIVKCPITPDDIPDPILYLTHRFYTGDVPVCSRASCQAQLKKDIEKFEELKRSLKKGEKRGKVHRDKIKVAR